MDFCTTPDCVAAAQTILDGEGNGSIAAAVPFSAATDGRDHWLAPGEPHCADCHTAPFVEPSPADTSSASFRPPFNYPRKASLMRYSSGHQGISCQGCHESIHGLYPVSPAIDTTSYAQAAALNADGSHGPLKCGTCHTVDGSGIPNWIESGGAIAPVDFDDVVAWAHTYTEEANVLNSTCQNCHGVNGVFSAGAMNPNSVPADWTDVASHEVEFLSHAMEGWTSREMMDKAEILVSGRVTGLITANKDKKELKALCSDCHEGNKKQSNKLGSVTCNNEWREHLAQGRVAEAVWEKVSMDETGTSCGW
jgi:mono/diheme cytochrome c family protein